MHVIIINGIVAAKRRYCNIFQERASKLTHAIKMYRHDYKFKP